MTRFGYRKFILEILIKMGWSRVRLEAKRPPLEMMLQESW